MSKQLRVLENIRIDSMDLIYKPLRVVGLFYSSNGIEYERACKFSPFDYAATGANYIRGELITVENEEARVLLRVFPDFFTKENVS